MNKTAKHMRHTSMEMWISKTRFALFSQHIFPIILIMLLISTFTPRNTIHPEKTLCLDRTSIDLLCDTVFI